MYMQRSVSQRSSCNIENPQHTREVIKRVGTFPFYLKDSWHSCEGYLKAKTAGKLLIGLHSKYVLTPQLTFDFLWQLSTVRCIKRRERKYWEERNAKCFKM